MTGMLEVTNQLVAYTNAVLNLLMPQITEFAKKADLPEQWSSVAEVRRVDQIDPQKLDCVVTFKTRNLYWFSFGYVQAFESAHAFYALQNPNLVPNYYAPQNMTKEEAIELARKTIRKLGYTEEMLYADLEPEVYTPAVDGTNIIPHYRISWPAANRDITSARFEINGNNKTIESIWFLNWNLVRDPPPIPGREQAPKAGLVELPQSETNPLMLGVLPLIADFSKRLGLPAPYPLGSNSIARYPFYNSNGYPIGKITLTNGLLFTVLTNRVLGFAAPDEFFAETHEVKVKEFLGKWNLSDDQVVQKARECVRKLGIPKRAVAGLPRIDKPFGAAKALVPRCALYWSEDGCPPVQVEVAADSGDIKAVMIW